MVGSIPPPCCKQQAMGSLSLLPELYHIIQEKINNIEQLGSIIGNLSGQLRNAT